MITPLKLVAKCEDEPCMWRDLQPGTVVRYGGRYLMKLKAVFEADAVDLMTFQVDRIPLDTEVVPYEYPILQLNRT